MSRILEKTDQLQTLIYLQNKNNMQLIARKNDQKKSSARGKVETRHFLFMNILISQKNPVQLRLGNVYLYNIQLTNNILIL